MSIVQCTSSRTAVQTALALPGSLFFCCAVFASPKYQEVLVTATLTPVSYLESLAADSVFDEHEISALQAKDLPDVLRQVIGLDFVDNGGRGSLSALRVRGTESDHVLYLVDGVRIADASSGSTALQSIPLAHIERIEIVRGPRSALYGADALGGVIQVFTKQGQSGVATPGLRASYGSHDSRKGEANIRGGKNNFFYRAAAGYEESNGIDRTVGGVGADLDRDGYREKNYALNGGYRFGDAAKPATLSAGWIGSNARSEFDSGSGSAQDFSNVRVGVGNLRYQHSLGDALALDLLLGHSVDDQRSRGANDSNFKTRRNSAKLQLNSALAEGQEIAGGVDYYIDKVDSSANFVEDRRENYALFLQYLADYGAMNVQLAARHDDNHAFGEETTSNVALGVKLGDKLVASLSYGTSFKAPTFNELYFPFTDFGFGFTFEGNPDLEPESAETVELLLKHDGSALSGYASVHYTEIDDLITTTATSTANIDKARIHGADMGVQFGLHAVDVRFGVSYIHAEDTNTGERLLRRPRVSALLDVSGAIADVEWGLGWNADGNRVDTGGELAGYNLLDARLVWHASNEIRLGTIVRNVFGNNYTLVKGFQEFRTEGQTASVFIEYAP
ncbi:MAG: TonB-dependent receptor [Pseudomonadales bacterium]|nr:TonB-dependent receptor [Pseudomonadales bacterium]